MKKHTAVELTREELREIAAHRPLWADLEVQNADDMFTILEQSYCGKFKITSDQPDDVHDLFMIQYDNLEVPPVSLTRDQFGNLQIIDVIR